MSITATVRFDESQFHPPSQPMNLNSSLIQSSMAANRAGSEALKQLGENEEAFQCRQLSGGTNGYDKCWSYETRSCYDWCCDCFPKEAPVEGQVFNRFPAASPQDQVEGNDPTI